MNFENEENFDLQTPIILNRTQVNAVLNTIKNLASTISRKKIITAFDLVILNLRENTGEVMLTRHQLAQEICCSPNNAGRIMNILISIGVVRFEFRKVKSTRGANTKVYFVNPHVAWKGNFIAFRAKTADSKPPAFPSM